MRPCAIIIIIISFLQCLLQEFEWLIDGDYTENYNQIIGLKSRNNDTSESDLYHIYFTAQTIIIIIIIIKLYLSLKIL